MTSFRQPPRRHWRSYGNDPLPTPAEAMAEPFSAFPSWFLRVECYRCGKDRVLSETHKGHTATCRSATSSPGCVTTAAAAGQGRWSC